MKFFPQQVPFPNTTADTYLRQAASGITNILQLPKNNIPSLTYGNKTNNAIIDIVKLSRRDTPPKFPEITKITPGPEETHNPAKKPRMQPKPTKYIPASEPRVLINHTRAKITQPAPKSGKSVSSPPGIKSPSPSINVQTQQSTKYKDTFASKIMEVIHKKNKKGDKYTSISRRGLGFPTRHNHFTR